MVVLDGDGVGPEVIGAARRVLDWLIDRRNFPCEVEAHDYGLSRHQRTGSLLDDELLDACMSADAVLFGAMGGPGYDRMRPEERRKGSVLRLRAEMKVFANLRPAAGWAELADAVPLKEEVIDNVDLLLVREANGGAYFGTPRGIEDLGNGEQRGFNTDVYTTSEVKRVARTAFRLARERGGRVCSVDKSNVLEVGVVWREAVTQVHRDEFPDLELVHMLVDNCAMQLVRNPRQFDVLVTSNMFGDILSDGAAAIMGSLGMAASASLNDAESDGRRRALYEPVHGSAPDIAGQGIANPLGCIASLALALRHSLDRVDDAGMVERAMRAAVGSGVRTPDIAGRHRPVGTAAMTAAVLRELDRLAG